jgi:hypothetical protein
MTQHHFAKIQLVEHHLAYTSWLTPVHQIVKTVMLLSIEEMEAKLGEGI